MRIVCIANDINRNVYVYLNTCIFPTSGYARVLLFMFIRRELGGTGTGCLFQFTYCEHVSAAIHYISVSVFFLRVRCSHKHKCGRYRNAFNMREVIIHAQPSSGSMHLIFGPYVRPNGACLSRLLHIVDNFICLC